jgi:hypothetical protein
MTQPSITGRDETLFVLNILCAKVADPLFPRHARTRGRTARQRSRSDLVGRPGLEPGTYGLKVRYSAIELTPLDCVVRCSHRMKRTE